MRDGKKMTTEFFVWKICEKATRNDISRKEEQIIWREWDGKIKEWVNKYNFSMFEWKKSKGNMQTITSEGKKDLTKQIVKSKTDNKTKEKNNNGWPKEEKKSAWIEIKNVFSRRERGNERK